MKKMEDRGSRTDYIATVFDFFGPRLWEIYELGEELTNSPWVPY